MAREDDLSFRLSSNPASDAREQRASSDPTPDPDAFCILLCADFTGRTNRGVVEPATLHSRKMHAVDADTLPRVLATMQPHIALPISEKAALSLAFRSLEDFHPDALIQQIPAYQALAQLRAALLDPATARDAAAKVRTLSGAAAPAEAMPAQHSESAGTSDFERLLDGPIARKPPADSVHSLIAGLVAGSSAPDAEPDHAALLAFLEETLTGGLRAVLRHPAFQAIESAWRSVAFLTSRLNAGGRLKIVLLDISKEELAADLAAPETSALHQRLAEQMDVPGSVPFSLVVGDYAFDHTPGDLALLQQVGGLMRAANAAFIAGAAPALLEISTFADITRLRDRSDSGNVAWENLRGDSDSDYVGLAAPRFLLRRPFGPNTDSIDTFPFTEISDGPTALQPAYYLWANGAIAVAHAIAEGVLNNEAGGDFASPIEPVLQLVDLPVHTAMIDGESQQLPAAQEWLTDRAGTMMRDAGLMALLSLRGAAALRINGIRSISVHNSALAGRAVFA